MDPEEEAEVHKKDESTILKSKRKDEIKDKEMKAMEDEGTPCSSFFQQQGAIDYKNYIRLKIQELKAIKFYRAAIMIQSAWRGFLIRENMKILHASAIKIQALMRGALARIRYGPMLTERLKNRLCERRIKAATKIQAFWRGYHSRRNNFDFKKYTALMKKNQNMQESIKKINELESVLMKQLHLTASDEIPVNSSIEAKMGSKSSLGSMSIPFGSATTESLDDLIRTSFNQLSKSMSKCRIEELLTYVTTQVADVNRNRRSSSVRTSIRKTSSQGEKMRIIDSVDDLFPEFPDEEDLVKPDSEKVEALKAAIRLLRVQIKSENTSRLQKKHFLLRTKNCPGIYSNIYSNELTDIEKELKEVKFWNPEELDVNEQSKRTFPRGGRKTNPSKEKDDSIRNSITKAGDVKNVGMRHGEGMLSPNDDPLTSIKDGTHVFSNTTPISPEAKSERPYPDSEFRHNDQTFNTPVNPGIPLTTSPVKSPI